MKTSLINSSLILALLVSVTAGCTKTGEYHPEIVPDGLKDCKFYTLRSTSGREVVVTRCPSTTSTDSGQK